MIQGLKVIPSTIFVTYVIMLISLLNSVIMVNFYGLSLRGELALFILLPSIIAGSAAAFCEEQYALSRMNGRYHTLLFLIFFIIFIILVIFSERDFRSLIIIYILINIEYAVASLLIIFLKYDLFYYNLIRFLHPTIFILLNFYPSGISSIAGNPLVFNYTFSGFIVLLFAVIALYWKNLKILNDENKSTKPKITKNVLFNSFYITRPATSSIDKILLSSLLPSDGFGAYVTLSNIFSLSNPLLNTILQFSFFNHIKKISSGVLNLIWVICAVIVISSLTFVDHLLYDNQLENHFELLYFIGLFSIINLNIRHLENKTIKIVSESYLPLFKATAVIITLVFVNWNAKFASIFILIMAILYLYQLSKSSKELISK